MSKTYLYHGLFIALILHAGFILLPWLNWFAEPKQTAGHPPNPSARPGAITLSVYKTAAAPIDDASTDDASQQQTRGTIQEAKPQNTPKQPALADDPPQQKPVLQTQTKSKAKANAVSKLNATPTRQPKPVAAQPQPSAATSAAAIKENAVATPGLPARQAANDAATKSAYLQRLQAEISRRQRYPRISRQRAEQGRVIVRLVIQANGKFRDIQLDRSSGYPRLDKAAIKTLQQIERFAALPVTRDVPEWVIKVPLVFRMHN